MAAGDRVGKTFRNVWHDERQTETEEDKEAERMTIEDEAAIRARRQSELLGKVVVANALPGALPRGDTFKDVVQKELKRRDDADEIERRPK